MDAAFAAAHAALRFDGEAAGCSTGDALLPAAEAHVTLAVLRLGAAAPSPSALAAVASALAATPPPPPTLALRGLGDFDRGRVGYLHVDGDDGGELVSLAASVEAAIASVDLGLLLPPPRRVGAPFVPHVTVVKIRAPAPGRRPQPAARLALGAAWAAARCSVACDAPVHPHLLLCSMLRPRARNGFYEAVRVTGL